jgi:Zn finger protein HypA/HybF involved in hydrogenase expression
MNRKIAISSSLRDYKVEAVMGKCLKGESEVKEKAATYACEKCGAQTDNKSHLCEPKKIKSKK